VTISPILISDKVISIAARWFLIMCGAGRPKALPQGCGSYRFRLDKSMIDHQEDRSVKQTPGKGLPTEARLKYFPQTPSSSPQPAA
jgi:hypothetical protein